MSDAKLKRAGLDYHDLAHVKVHSNFEDALAEVTPKLRSRDARGATSHVKEIEVSPAKATSQGGSTRTLTLVTVED